MDVTQKTVITFAEACEYTGYSRSHMQKLTAAGIIPHSKPTGKLIFFDRKELEAWLMQNKKKGNQKKLITAPIL